MGCIVTSNVSDRERISSLPKYIDTKGNVFRVSSETYRAKLYFVEVVRGNTRITEGYHSLFDDSGNFVIEAALIMGPPYRDNKYTAIFTEVTYSRLTWIPFMPKATREAINDQNNYLANKIKRNLHKFVDGNYSFIESELIKIN